MDVSHGRALTPPTQLFPSFFLSLSLFLNHMSTDLTFPQLTGSCFQRAGWQIFVNGRRALAVFSEIWGDGVEEPGGLCLGLGSTSVEISLKIPPHYKKHMLMMLFSNMPLLFFRCNIIQTCTNHK